MCAAHISSVGVTKTVICQNPVDLVEVVFIEHLIIFCKCRTYFIDDMCSMHSVCKIFNDVINCLMV